MNREPDNPGVFKSVTLIAHSEKNTIRFGELLGSILESGDVVALQGELGSGKTWFVKGLALGLDVPAETVITSPSFALVNEYRGRIPLFHMDVYRLENLSDFLAAGLEECFHEEGVVAMEWADRWPDILPPLTVTIHIEIIDEASRRIDFSGSHKRVIEILERLNESLKRG